MSAGASPKSRVAVHSGSTKSNSTKSPGQSKLREGRTRDLDGNVDNGREALYECVVVLHAEGSECVWRNGARQVGGSGRGAEAEEKRGKLSVAGVRELTDAKAEACRAPEFALESCLDVRGARADEGTKDGFDAARNELKTTLHTREANGRRRGGGVDPHSPAFRGVQRETGLR